MKKILLVTALLFMSNAFATDDEDTFNQLKQLEGKWVGTINYSNRDAEPINLQYSIRSNGSALLEESNEGGTEMMTIFNLHNDNILATHYCAAQNRPVAELKSNKSGIISLVTNQEKSGLDSNKEMFVESWELNLMLENKDIFIYEYKTIGPDGSGFTAKAEMKRVK
jgi:hypothetical protein|tara:strand:+ start:84 stop:584 length:501 start_codon:yes stop_codon:yes gene_type:complete